MDTLVSRTRRRCSTGAVHGIFSAANVLDCRILVCETHTVTRHHLLDTVCMKLQRSPLIGWMLSSTAGGADETDHG